MQVALNGLQDEGATVGEVANRLGYRSEAAFAVAFKRVIGVPPGGIRRARDERTETPVGTGPLASLVP